MPEKSGCRENCFLPWKRFQIGWKIKEKKRNKELGVCSQAKWLIKGKNLWANIISHKGYSYDSNAFMKWWFLRFELRFGINTKWWSLGWNDLIHWWVFTIYIWNVRKDRERACNLGKRRRYVLIFLGDLYLSPSTLNNKVLCSWDHP